MDLTHWSEDPVLEQKIIDSDQLVPAEQASMLMLLRGYTIDEISKALRLKPGYIERMVREAASALHNEDGYK